MERDAITPRAEVPSCPWNFFPINISFLNTATVPIFIFFAVASVDRYLTLVESIIDVLQAKVSEIGCGSERTLEFDKRVGNGHKPIPKDKTDSYVRRYYHNS